MKSTFIFFLEAQFDNRRTKTGNRDNGRFNVYNLDEYEWHRVGKWRWQRYCEKRGSKLDRGVDIQKMTAQRTTLHTPGSFPTHRWSLLNLGPRLLFGCAEFED